MQYGEIYWIIYWGGKGRTKRIMVYKAEKGKIDTIDQMIVILHAILYPGKHTRSNFVH